MNRESFTTGEYYHVYNRGVDKRDIVVDLYDADRFIKSLKFFNSVRPIQSLYSLSFNKEPDLDFSKKLVQIIAYCLNPNHYHIILKQMVRNGISEFMKRLNGGYTYYFNYKNNRSGSLFQGRYKSRHISDNNYLLRVSAYVNLNNEVHQLRGSTSKLVRSSWSSYADLKNGENDEVCKTSIILDQFPNRTAYKIFAREALVSMLSNKVMKKELGLLLLE